MREMQQLTTALQLILRPIIKEVVLATIEEQTPQLQQKKDVQLTADQAAEQLHTTKVTLWRWAKLGYLSPIKVGRKVYYWQSDIDKITQKREA